MPKIMIIAGCDIAERGEDFTVITIAEKDLELNKYKVLHIESWGQVDLMPTVGRIIPLLKQFNVERATVDATGVGSGVYSRLEELRTEGKLNCQIRAFKGGMSPLSEQAKQRFLNQKAEAYWHLRSLFEHGKIMIPNHKKLISELSKMKWELTSSEKIRILDPGVAEHDTSEQKSPDYSDSLCYCVYDGGLPGFAIQFIKLGK